MIKIKKIKKKILIITESPNKVQTISDKINKLNLNFEIKILCTKGHLFDLKKYKSIGLKRNDNEIELLYIELKNKKTIIKNIEIWAKKSDEVFLATDPDREGEIISFLIYDKILRFNILNKKIKIKRL